MYISCRPEYSTNEQADRHVAKLLGVGHYDTVIKWARQSEVDDGVRAGVSTDEKEELRRLRREVADLKRTNGILRAASAFFAAELDRPPSK